MTARIGPARALAGTRWGEPLLAALIAGVSAAILIAVGPPPEDAPVHLYRTFLVRQGAVVWDNLWYSGHYPLSYGILFPGIAAVVGNLIVVLVGAVLSAAIFAMICMKEFGDAARWPARIFGVLAAAPLFTGLDSYSLGLATLLGVLSAAQSRRPRLAAVLCVATVAFSPLAFAFLCVIIGALGFVRRARSRDHQMELGLGLGMAVAGALFVGVLLAFPNGGIYPFNGWDLLAVLGLCVAGGALALRDRRGRVIAAILALWGAACVVSFALPSPLGDNIARLRGLALPVVLLAALLAGFRPRWLTVIALTLALANNVVPYLMLFPDQANRRPSRASFWAPSIDYLRAHLRPGDRVEVVPTAAHWEAYFLPRAGLPLARGWFRQLDPPSLYDGRLDAVTYLGWLRRSAVRYVVLPHARLDQAGGPTEARIVSGHPGSFTLVSRNPNATIYALRGSRSLLTGAAGDRILGFGHTDISGLLAAPGSHLLRVRYMPYWKVDRGEVCLRRDPSGLTRIEAAKAGAFRLRVDQSLAGLVSRFLDRGTPEGCPPAWRPARESGAPQAPPPMVTSPGSVGPRCVPHRLGRQNGNSLRFGGASGDA